MCNRKLSLKSVLMLADQFVYLLLSSCRGYNGCILRIIFIGILSLRTFWWAWIRNRMLFTLLILAWVKNTGILRPISIYLIRRIRTWLGLLGMHLSMRILASKRVDEMIWSPLVICWCIWLRAIYLGRAFG